MGDGAVVLPRRGRPCGLRLSLRRTAFVPDTKGRTGGRLNSMLRGVHPRLLRWIAGMTWDVEAIVFGDTAIQAARSREIGTSDARGPPLGSLEARCYQNLRRQDKEAGVMAVAIGSGSSRRGRAAKEADAPDGLALRESLPTCGPSCGGLPRSKGGGADVLPLRCGPRGLRLLWRESIIVPETEGLAEACQFCSMLLLQGHGCTVDIGTALQATEAVTTRMARVHGKLARVRNVTSTAQAQAMLLGTMVPPPTQPGEGGWTPYLMIPSFQVVHGMATDSSLGPPRLLPGGRRAPNGMLPGCKGCGVSAASERVRRRLWRTAVSWGPGEPASVGMPLPQ